MILLWTSKIERIPLLLQKYACGRSRQLDFLLPWATSSSELSRCVATCAARCSCYQDLPFPVASVGHAFPPLPAGPRFPSTVGRSIARHMREHVPRGVDLLYAHADMWLNVSAIVKAAAGGVALSPVYAFADPGPQASDLGRRSVCFADDAALDADVSWTWWAQSKALCKAASTIMRAHGRAMPCCRGWADLLFVPHSLHTAFIELFERNASRGFAEGRRGVLWDVHSEVALHTAMNVLNTSGPRRGRWATIGCHGAPREHVTWAATASSGFLCGHRVDLADPKLASHVAREDHAKDACHARTPA